MARGFARCRPGLESRPQPEAFGGRVCSLLPARSPGEAGPPPGALGLQGQLQARAGLPTAGSQGGWEFVRSPCDRKTWSPLEPSVPAWRRQPPFCSAENVTFENPGEAGRRARSCREAAGGQGRGEVPALSSLLSKSGWEIHTGRGHRHLGTLCCRPLSLKPSTGNSNG